MRIRQAIADGVHALFRLAPLEVALTRFTAGKPGTALAVRLAPSNTCHRAPAYRAVLRNGIRYRLDISDYQDWLVYWRVDIDRPTSLYELAREGAVVVDVGANLGEACLNLAQRVGPAGRVFAFEPDAVSFGKLTHNLSLNPFTNVVLSQIALGEAPGVVTMKVNCASNRGGNRITPDAAEAAEHFDVPVQTLDSFVHGAGLTRVDLIKIDVEGFELSVLRGAREVLRRFRPVLFIEVGDSNQREQGSSAAALVRSLEAAGYDVFDASTGASLHGLPLDDYHHDAICRPRLIGADSRSVHD